MERSVIRLLIALSGIAVVTYSLVVLAVVAVAPDLRLRMLLVDPHSTSLVKQGVVPSGVRIERLLSPRVDGPAPQPGDILLRIGDVPIQAFSDAARTTLHLGHQPLLPGARIAPGVSPLTQDLPTLVDEDGGPRWVEVMFQRATTGLVEECRIALQPLPWSESLPTFLWFGFELVILGIGLFAFWHRPFDRPTRLFYAMCVVTMGAFVPGFHWWLISGSIALTIPFVICAVLVPVVTLHFFLVYPRPKLPSTGWPRLTMTGLYITPLAVLVWLLVSESAVWWLINEPPSDDRALALVRWLSTVRTAVYAYLGLAALYFVGTLVALVHSMATTRNALERSQVAWILWAGVAATVFIAYTLMLAYWSRVDFALGGARWPMFAASLLFMLAYTVGLLRYKLIHADDLIRRGPLYYSLIWGSSLVTAMVVVAAGVGGGTWVETQPGSQPLLLATVLVVVVLLVLMGRDVLQKRLQRRFLRDRHRLDRAMRRMDSAVGQLADVQSLSQQMLSSCRELLQAQWAAWYMIEDSRDGLRLDAVDGDAAMVPLQWVPTSEFWDQLAVGGCWRLTDDHGVVTRSTDATTLPDLELAQLLEIDGAKAGLLVLGPKLTGGLYGPEELTVLAALSRIAGVALQCARIRQGLQQVHEELRVKVERIAQQKEQILLLQAELSGKLALEPAGEMAPAFQCEAIVGNSPALRQVLATARKVAASETTVLILGESGTGKELLARALHQNSARRNGPMVTVHCAALSPGLLESELFGHVRGAFTGAHADRRGRFELAEGGTLFLDEVGDIPLETQVKLLRVLQERQIEPVGSSTPIAINVRVIAATHRPLDQMIQQGRFREDLFYRLNVVSLTLPPLRDRVTDIYELAKAFLQRVNSQLGKGVVDVSDDALQVLRAYSWPGNIRELDNVIERAVVLADGPAIELIDLPDDVVAAVDQADLSRAPFGSAAEASPVGSAGTSTPAGSVAAAGASSSVAAAVSASSVGSGKSARPIGAGISGVTSGATGLARPPGTRTGSTGLGSLVPQPVAAGLSASAARGTTVVGTVAAAPSESSTGLPAAVPLHDGAEFRRREGVHRAPSPSSPEPSSVLPVRSGAPQPPGFRSALTEQPVGRLPANGLGDVDDQSVDDEEQRLLQALQQAGGNKAKAAQILGLPRSTFFSRLKKLGLLSAASDRRPGHRPR
jgi:formate hydrogenlyase transcriptional activator